MRKCGPFSEGFSTRTSLALALRASVRTVPVKPLPFEVKVPMVAIVVSFSVFRAAPTAASMAGYRPEAIDPHPERGRHAVEGSQATTFLISARNGRAAARGRKSWPDVAGIRARRSKATTAFGQTCQIEDAVGAPEKQLRDTDSQSSKP